MKLFKITHLTTSGYHPQTNGSLERSHAPLMDTLCVYAQKYNDWDYLLPFATFIYNTSEHSATNFTLHELVYGRIARFPISIPKEEKLRTYNLYLQDLITRLHEMKLEAAERQMDIKERTKERYDNKMRLFTGKVGDYGWVIKEARTGKFGH